MKMKKHYPLALSFIAFLALSPIHFRWLVAPAAGGAQKDIVAEVSQLSADRYMRDLIYLASDELKGRASGSPELEKAAEYIASQFRSAGLQPAGDNNTYFQTFEITTGTAFGNRNRLEVGGAVLEDKKDFVPIAFSSSDNIDAHVVFAGYGITASELQWDDYQGIDVKGKVVVVFRHEPQELDSNSRWNGTKFTTHAAFVNKAINARQHGAKGIIFITDPLNHKDEPDEVGPATKAIEANNVGIAAIHARRGPILALFARAGKDLTAIQQTMDQNLKPASFELAGIRLRMVTDITRIRKPVRNVIAALPGSDPTLRNESVVIGGHYDHLGLGDSHTLAPSQIGQIHHGADDNASGSSGVIEVARVAAANKQSFKRSLLFIAFAGEELGLLGSAHFVDRPTVPLDRIIAMLNMDMIGRLKNDQVFMGGVGTSPNFRGWLEQAAAALKLRLDYSDSGIGGSDHMSFNKKHIPILFFFTGLHADYHRPSDTSDKINAPGAIRVLSLTYEMAKYIANEPSRPQYVEVHEPQLSGSNAGGGGDAYGPYFGSVPDFRDDLNGVLFADVRPDSPAGKAGLRGGDLMIEFDGKEIKNLYDFTYALQAKKPGDVVVVVVQRTGQMIKVNVTLEARK
jgi:Peptidase family M28/PDZ domain/PA domain